MIITKNKYKVLMKQSNEDLNDVIQKLIVRADNVFFYLDYSYTRRCLIGNK